MDVPVTCLVSLTREPIDIGTAFEALADPACGGTVTFLGTVRNHSRRRRVLRMEYEAYEEMAGEELRRLAEEAWTRFGLGRVVLIHRFGPVDVNESVLFIGASAPHRAEAFEATRFLIDAIKVRVPIWKKEYYEDGACWVEGDAPSPH